MRGWRWLFIIEGIPAVVVGVITIWYLTDWPAQAHWLPADEKSWITAELQREKEAKNRRRTYRVWEALRHRDVILLTGCYFCAMTGSYGIAFWLPTILKRLSGKSDLKVTLLAALPYVACFVLAGGSFYGFQPVFWAVPTLFLSESAAAASIGLINAVGNLGGFVGPMVIGYLANRTHSFSPGLLYLVASLFVSGSLMLAIGRQHATGEGSPIAEG